MKEGTYEGFSKGVKERGNERQKEVIKGKQTKEGEKRDKETGKEDSKHEEDVEGANKKDTRSKRDNEQMEDKKGTMALQVDKSMATKAQGRGMKEDQIRKT